MKKQAFIVYYADRSANVVICDGISAVASSLSEVQFSQVVKIELIPFEVL